MHSVTILEPAWLHHKFRIQAHRKEKTHYVAGIPYRLVSYLLGYSCGLFLRHQLLPQTWRTTFGTVTPKSLNLLPKLTRISDRSSPFLSTTVNSMH